MNQLEEIKARVDAAIIHQNLDPSVYAEMAWSVVEVAPKLVAALEAVEVLHVVSEMYNFSLCNECASPFPCDTYTAIQEALQ